MIGFPFDSHVEYDEHGAPSYDRAISSKPLKALIKDLFSTGVMPNPSNNLQVSAGTDGMTVIVHAGFCVIEGGLKLEDEDRELVLDGADTQDRIDTVVMRWNDNLRTCDLYVVKGTPASIPVRPALTRTSSIYEIGLADIFVTRNLDYISNSRITDTRYESARCGIVSSVSEWDTTTITQQIEAMLAEKSDAFDEVIAQDDSDFQTWFEGIQEQLSDDVAGRLLTLINNTRSQVGLPDEFDSTRSYAVGDYCIHENVLYRCITATTGTWDASKWVATTVMGEQLTGSRKMCDASGSALNVGSLSVPVYFNNGVPMPSSVSNLTPTFTSSDVPDSDVTTATGWTSITKLTSGLSLSGLFYRISQMFKNVRWLYKMLGTTDISTIGNGTVTGAISSLNTSLAKGSKVSVTFPFTPSENGMLVLGMLQMSANAVSRTMTITEDTTAHYTMNIYFSGAWSGATQSIPLRKGHTYTLTDTDGVYWGDRTYFMY